jgi:uncharacterized FAD-dependent dehydrogenase
MCPGGVIAPCATSAGRGRDQWLVAVQTRSGHGQFGYCSRADSSKILSHSLKFGALAGVEFQKSIEQKAWHLAGQTQKVPAQRMIDFTQSKVSATHPENIICSRHDFGRTRASISWIPITQVLRQGFTEFGKSMKGYLTNDAILHAPESRTSSPVRIPRNPETLEHVQIKGLYPCGEGAGYAGGIISAAIDGEKCALKIAESLKN